MDFKTANSIKLKPEDLAYGAAFKFPVASTATSNDGFLPKGTYIDSASVTAWYNGTSVSDLVAGDPTISGTDTVQVTLNYPTTTMSGVTKDRYMSLRFVLTLDSSATLQADFDNLIVKV
jgi:hypothetical protein